MTWVLSQNPCGVRRELVSSCSDLHIRTHTHTHTTYMLNALKNFKLVLTCVDYGEQSKEEWLNSVLTQKLYQLSHSVLFHITVLARLIVTGGSYFWSYQEYSKSILNLTLWGQLCVRLSHEACGPQMVTHCGTQTALLQACGIIS